MVGELVCGPADERRRWLSGRGLDCDDGAISIIVIITCNSTSTAYHTRR